MNRRMQFLGGNRRHYYCHKWSNATAQLAQLTLKAVARAQKGNALKRQLQATYIHICMCVFVWVPAASFAAIAQCACVL